MVIPPQDFIPTLTLPLRERGFFYHRQRHRVPELAYHSIPHRFHLHHWPHLRYHRSHGAVGDATGDDVAVVRQVGAYVEGEAVEGYATAYLDADGGYLAAGGPDAGEARLGVGGDVEVCSACL